MDEIEIKARDQGWVPQEEFRGDPSKWVDAAEFVERGERILPILRAHNKKYESEVARLTAENRRLAEMFHASQESITELQQFHEQNVKEQLAAQRRTLAADLRSAREEGDVDAEVEIQAKIAELGRVPEPAAKPAPAAPAPSAPQVDPELVAWQRDNPWFGTDVRKTKEAMGIAQLLEADPDNAGLAGRAFYDRVVEEMQRRHTPGGMASKVGGGRPSGDGGGGGGRGQGYDALPPDAKEACDRQGRKLVGEGRAFKDQASWQAYYAKLYFKGEAA